MMPEGRARAPRVGPGDACDLDRHASAGDPAPMHIQTLSSGSKGNATLVRAGETHLLVDVGLTLRELDRRLEAARVPPRGIHHMAVTHGHLDHAKSAGALSKRFKIPVSCAERIMSNASMRRAVELRAFTVGRPFAVDGPRGDEGLRVTPVKIPHDADPTVAFRLDHETAEGVRSAVVLTDMGHPRAELMKSLGGAHVLVLEFNYDAEMLATGPYPPKLKQRVAGNGGHLSNDQAAEVLEHLAGPELHTLVLAHLSETNNTPERAREVAESALQRMGRGDVRVIVAPQYEVGPNLEV